MTVIDLIYYIGCGVAFIMTIIGSISACEKNKIEKNFLGILVCGAAGGLLSWAIPIWWLGFHFLVEKKR